VDQYKLKGGGFEELFAIFFAPLLEVSMSKAVVGARVVLGLIYFVFGLNGFLNFIPQPPLPESAMGYMGGLAAAPYFFPVLKGTEVIGGLLILANVFSPLALVILAPISLHILLFHLFLAPEGLPIAIAIVALHVFLGLRNMGKYRPMFSGM
jgi:uncharacterized membrane protein YphA (DoxX/SURF4 family)